ncbi:class I SAM-dependent methyltransferase [Micromonospora sp. WMMD1082]|uniref:class I SAM-dependent methyltransferase n=1 Tax=Micromonospora sp. WMMD1082 TaxID=3016104 RepID=UPI0024175754|nr:class I SAM-dependent methyltransferase [Micromonospora sp. WMMD1082]MDG4795141.1 class I SAM-dependent methyltransferase [Micromonospora sp. WMMD1082]
MTDQYTIRARCYAAELAGLTPPRLLPAVLRFGIRVAEVPSGTGHFLPAYRAVDARVLLIDANAAMLRTAAEDAAVLPRLATVHARVEDLGTEVGPVDLVVVPNGALNQLTHDGDLTHLLHTLARLLAPGGRLLAQTLLTHADGVTDVSGFYDPHRDGEWFIDRRFTGPGGEEMVRRRRQHRSGDTVTVDFALTSDGNPAYEQTVALRVLDPATVRATVTRAGLTLDRVLPGRGQLSEVLASRPLGGRS